MAALRTPLLTIAIPTRQRESELSELLQSIARNDCTDVEVVVSDNASTVRTGDIARGFAAECAARGEWPRVMYVRRPEMLSFDLSVNAAVESSAGKYIWLMGDDDRLVPDALPKLIKLLSDGEYTTGLINYSDWNADFSRCNTQSVMDVDGVRTGLSVGDLLVPSNFWFSFMSIHVVRKDLWMACDRSVYYRERLDNIQLYVPLLAARHGGNFIIGDVLLEKRSSYLAPEGLDSTDIVGSWYRAIDTARGFGVPQSICDLFYRTYINDFHCTRDLLAKKIRRSPIYRKDSAFIHIHYRRFPHYWIKVWPVRWLPRWLLVLMRSSFKAVRSVLRKLR